MLAKLKLAAWGAVALLIVVLYAGRFFSMVADELSAPKAVITGPTAGTPGEMLFLSGADSTGAAHYLWRVTPDTPGRKVLVTHGGQRCQISSVPGEFRVELAVANAVRGIDTAYWTVTVAGEMPKPQPSPPPAPAPQPAPPGPTPQPAPSPGPNPGPAPAPPAPAPAPGPVTPPNPPSPAPVPPQPGGAFGVSADVTRWGMLVQSPRRSAEAQALAAAANTVAADIAAGRLNGAAKILAAIVHANTVALAASVAEWKPFTDPMAGRLRELYLAGRLPDNAAWAALLLEVAGGLRAVT